MREKQSSPIAWHRPTAHAIASAVIASFLGCSSGPPPEATGETVARNFVLVSIDTLRADRVGPYREGSSITPRIDELAGRGATFVTARTATPMTLPSHAVMLTGRLPPELALRDNGFRLDPRHETLAEVLSDRGFQCAGFVGAHVLASPYGLAQGFATYDDSMPYTGGGRSELRAEAVVRRAVRWLDDAPREPFFLFVHLFDPHTPYAAPEPWASRHESAYDGEVAYADSAVGTLVDALEQRGLADRTGVALVSDHGESLGEHGEATHGLFVYESTLRVPLILTFPGKIPAGIRVEGPARLVDLFPTVLDLFGMPSRETSGRSLWPVTDGRLAGVPTYAETLMPFISMGWSGSQALIRNERKFILAARPEAHDLGSDPRELKDLWPERPAWADEARVELIEDYQTDDTAPDRELSKEAREKLLSLGYVSGLSGPTPISSLDERLALPDPKDKVTAIARYETVQGRLQLGDLAGAIDELELLVREEPTSALALSLLGLTTFNAKDFARSESVYRRAVSLAPQRADLLAMLARALLALGKDDEAFETASAALRVDAQESAVHLVLAEVYRRRGDAAATRSALEAAVAADPGNTTVAVGLVHYLLQLGDDVAARQQLEAILLRAPDDLRALATRGVLHARGGDREAARRDFAVAAAIIGDAPDDWMVLASAEAQAGESALALGHAERAYALAPDRPDIRAALEQLRGQ